MRSIKPGCLPELQERFGYSLDALARRFEHSKSWVSGRLALIHSLPETIQDQVRHGALSAHAAMKYLVPMARADARAAERFATAVTVLKPSTREVGALYAGWQSGSARTRELILSSPQLYLQARAAAAPTPPSPTQRVLDDLAALAALAGIARRVYRTLQEGLLQQLLESEQCELRDAFARAKADLERFLHRFDLEYSHAG